MDNQCATLQGPLLRQYRKRDTESGVGAREIPLQYFIYRKLCTLYTKPLESNYKKKLTLCPPRLQRPLIRPLKYDIILKYVKGSEVPITDILSRVTPRLCPPPYKDIPSVTYQTTRGVVNTKLAQSPFPVLLHLINI